MEGRWSQVEVLAETLGSPLWRLPGVFRPVSRPEACCAMAEESWRPSGCILIWDADGHNEARSLQALEFNRIEYNSDTDGVRQSSGGEHLKNKVKNQGSLPSRWQGVFSPVVQNEKTLKDVDRSTVITPLFAFLVPTYIM
jgi:hypothetical protein